MNELEKFLELQNTGIMVECCLAQIDLALEQIKHQKTFYLDVMHKLHLQNAVNVYAYLMMTVTHVNLVTIGSLAKSEERINNEK